jgi:hypothetical protein
VFCVGVGCVRVRPVSAVGWLQGQKKVWRNGSRLAGWLAWWLPSLVVFCVSCVLWLLT